MPLTNQTMNIRSQGVVGVNNDPNSAPANTLLHCAPAQMFAIQMGDEQGRRIQTMVFRIGNMLYVDPNGEEWARKIRPIAETTWLAKQLREHFASLDKTVSIPKEDNVDLLDSAEQ
jgi:hypothetical protein